MKKRWRRLAPLVGLLMALLLVFTPAMPALAATSVTVDINATPAYISISVNNTSWDFSTVKAGVDEQTATAYFGIDNTGTTVQTNTTIVSDGWDFVSGGSTAWSWGAPAADTCQLKGSDGDGAFDVTIDDSTPVNLVSGTAAATNWTFEIQIDAASSYTHGDEQETTLTLSCVADF